MLAFAPSPSLWPSSQCPASVSITRLDFTCKIDVFLSGNIRKHAHTRFCDCVRRVCALCGSEAQLLCRALSCFCVRARPWAWTQCNGSTVSFTHVFPRISTTFQLQTHAQTHTGTVCSHSSMSLYVCSDSCALYLGAPCTLYLGTHHAVRFSLTYPHTRVLKKNYPHRYTMHTYPPAAYEPLMRSNKQHISHCTSYSRVAPHFNLNPKP
jgi:hypothetical protein